MVRKDKLQALVEKVNNMDLGGGGGAGYWSPPEGRSTIRILPSVGKMEFFFQEVGRHHFPPDGKKRVYCRNFTSEGKLDCPVCELVEDLYGYRDKASKELAGELRVRKAFWMNIVVRGEEEKGVRIYTPGVTVFGALVSIINDPDYGDVTDPEKGIDVVIEREGRGLSTEYNVIPKRHSTPISKDEKQQESWLKTAADLSWTEVGDDPEDDKELSEGYAIYVLPYDRIVKEFDLEDYMDFVDEDSDDEEYVEEDDDDEDIPEEDDDDEEVEEEEVHPAKKEISERRARRSSRRRVPRK